jgi:hypothetical protein
VNKKARIFAINVRASRFGLFGNKDLRLYNQRTRTRVVLAAAHKIILVL